MNHIMNQCEKTVKIVLAYFFPHLSYQSSAYIYYENIVIPGIHFFCLVHTFTYFAVSSVPHCNFLKFSWK